MPNPALKFLEFLLVAPPRGQISVLIYLIFILTLDFVNKIHAGEAMTRCLHFRLIAFNFEQVHQTDRNIRTDHAVLTVSQTVVISKYKSEARLSVCGYDELVFL